MKKPVNHLAATALSRMLPAIALAVFLTAMLTDNAQAYIDPSAGSAAIQIILAAAAAGMVGLKFFFGHIQIFLKRLFQGDRGEKR